VLKALCCNAGAGPAAAAAGAAAGRTHPAGGGRQRLLPGRRLRAPPRPRHQGPRHPPVIRRSTAAAAAPVLEGMRSPRAAALAAGRDSAQQPQELRFCRHAGIGTAALVVAVLA